MLKTIQQVYDMPKPDIVIPVNSNELQRVVNSSNQCLKKKKKKHKYSIGSFNPKLDNRNNIIK